MSRHVVDIWVCQGRMCTANEADRLVERAEEVLGDDDLGPRCRLLRGGCFGHCEMGPNVVVRRYARKGSRPSPDVDRLSITGRRNETMYCGVTPEDVEAIVRSHVEDDAVLVPLTYETRAAAMPDDSPVIVRIRRLREKRSA